MKWIICLSIFFVLNQCNINYSPIVNKYIIPVRIVVARESGIPILNQNDIDLCYLYTEHLWGDTKVDFIQVECEFIDDVDQYKRDQFCLIDDAEDHSNYLNIYVLPFREDLDILGIAPYPLSEHYTNWMALYVKLPCYYPYGVAYVMAHEWGHMMNIPHTFDDHNMHFPAVGYTNNIMDYNGCTDPVVEKFQIEKAQQSLWQDRRSYIIKK